MTNTELPYWLAALHLPDIGPRKIASWCQHFSSIEKLFTASTEELFAAGIPKKHIASLQQPNWAAVEAALAWKEKPNRGFMTMTDSDYPSLLKEISDPPFIFFIQGDRTALNQPQIAMVGSRTATATGLKNAEYFAYYLAQAGFAITSGLALGVDGASHRGALAAKGMTIGVAGTGLHHIYPTSHQRLVDEISANQGAVISEFPLETQPRAMNFPRRNRIIAGLSLGVLVVEAAVRSGSLITARHAIEHGREVFAIPGSIHNPLARGCHHLIRQGAKLVETATDILEELGAHASSFPKQLSLKPTRLSVKLDSVCKKLLTHIEHEKTPIDVIIGRSGLTAGEVSSILLRLELLGCIQSVPGGYILDMSKE